jgi:pyridoxal biosynthesis lyase PdxS
MIRSKGEAGTGDVSEAMKHIRKIRGEIAARHAELKRLEALLDAMPPSE